MGKVEDMGGEINPYSLIDASGFIPGAFYFPPRLKIKLHPGKLRGFWFWLLCSRENRLLAIRTNADHAHRPPHQFADPLHIFER